MKMSAIKTIIIAAIIIVAGGSPSFADSTATGSSYLLYEEWGGTWVDAEKTYSNTEDDYMCWAAAASNALDWTGWGRVAGVTTDDIFAYFQNHWTDAGGLMEFGWDWWFDGVNDSQSWAGWAHVDVPGGGFYPEYTFNNYYARQWYDPYAMDAIDEFTRAGYSVTLGVYTASGGGHAITCWGFNYNPDDLTDYYGIWVTDSDDSKYISNPQDRLRYYEVVYSESDGAWYLQDFYSSYDWYIGDVQALAKLPYDPITGDIDIDMDVDQSDLDILLAHFGIKSGMTVDEGDLDGDGDVDDSDLNLLLVHYGEVGTLVPEPAVMTLLIGGGIVLLSRKRS